MIQQINKVQAIEFATSATKTRELPRSVYRGLQLDFHLTHTNGAAPTITWETFCKMITKIEIVVNGRDTVMSLTGQQLYAMNYFDHAIAPVSSFFVTATASGTSYMSLYLPFCLNRAIKPGDTLLDVRRASSVVLAVTFGTSIESTSNISAYSSGYLYIAPDEYVEVPADGVFARHEIAYQVETIAATGEFLVKMPTSSNLQYRRFMLLTKDGSGNLSNGILSEIALRSRVFYWLNIDQSSTLPHLRNRMTRLYNIAPLTGLLLFDVTTDGRMTERIDAKSLPELIFSLNAAATGSVELLMDRVIYNN